MPARGHQPIHAHSYITQQSRRVNEQGKPVSQRPSTAEASAKHFFKCQLHATHVGAVGSETHSSSPTTSRERRIISLSLENAELNCFTAKRIWNIPTLHSKFLEILKFLFLSKVAHMSFCVKFSGLISQFKILEKSYLSPRMFNV